jgi:signal transduction histidine kinase
MNSKYLLFFLLLISLGCSQSNNVNDKREIIRKEVKAINDSILKEKEYSLKNDLTKIKRFESEYKNNNSTFKKISLLLLKGQVYSYAHNSYSSLEYYQTAKLLCEQSKEDSLLGLVYLGIGQNFSILRQNEEAIKNYNKAIPILNMYKLYHQISSAQTNIGLALMREKKYILALRQFYNSSNYYKKINKYSSIISSCNNLGECFLNMDNLDSAKAYFNQSFKYYLISKDSSFLAESYYGIASLKFKQKEYEFATFYAKQGYEISKKFNNNFLNHRLSLLLFNIFKEKGRYKTALDYKKEYDEYNAVVLEEEKQKTIKSLQLEYVTQKQKSENSQQKLEIDFQKKNNFLLGILSLTLCGFGLMLYFNFRKTNRTNILIKKQKEEISKINISLEERINQRTLELQNAVIELTTKNKEISEALLRGQTLERKRVASELHDGLGSHLVALQWSMMAIDTSNLSNKEADVYNQLQEMIKNAYDQVRNISHNMLPEELEKQGINATLTRYFNLLNINNTIKFHFSCNIKKIDNPKIEFELYQIILEYINNCIKHSKATEIYIEIKEQTNLITTHIKDNGIGFNVSKVKNSNGKGLRSILERTKSINGSWDIYPELNNNERSGISSYFQIPINFP